MKRPPPPGPAAALSAALALLAAGPAAAEPVVYTLDPAHSWVHFEVLHFGTSTIRGRIGPVQGSVTLDRAAGGGEVGLVIPTATVDTGIAVFNERLRQDDLLASKAYPEAYFVSQRFHLEGGELVSLRGEFTWRGVGQPLTLKALRFACRQDTGAGAGMEVCGGDFEAELLRHEFGATFGLPLVADRVRLQVQVEGRRPQAR